MQATSRVTTGRRPAARLRRTVLALLIAMLIILLPLAGRQPGNPLPSLLLLTLWLGAALGAGWRQRRLDRQLVCLKRGIGRLLLGDYRAPLDSRGAGGETALLGRLIERLVRSRVSFNRQLAEVRASRHALFERSPNPMLILDGARILDANPVALQLLGYRRAADLRGQPLALLQPRQGEADAESLLQRLAAAEGHFEWEFCRRDGQRLICELAAILVQQDGQPATRLFIRDIGERQRQERQIRRLAYQDPLTSLANGHYLKIRLQARLDALQEWRAEQPAPRFALLLVAIDNLKTIHTDFGQTAADDLLRMLADQLALLAPESRLARLGSDEFVLLQDEATDLYSLLRLARTLRRQAIPAAQRDNLHLEIALSVGIVVVTPRYHHVHQLLRCAGYALSQAQRQPGGGIRFYSRRLHREANLELSIRTDLPQAIRSGQLQPHFQPLVEADSGRVVGFEALARWQHPALGAISPARFIPIAENSQIIIALGEHVLRESCHFIAACPAPEGAGTPLAVHVNISARHFAAPSLVASIMAAIRDSGIQPGQLVIEITESLLMQRPRHSLATMRRIRQLGVGLALDDFGTGYSSLSSLCDYPLDAVKLDRSFVWRAAEGGTGAKLVHSITQMAGSLGFRLVAEGVETEAQRHTLQQLGIVEMQGFLFHRPLPGAEALRLLGSGRLDASAS